jgi:hypothetical protein
MPLLWLRVELELVVGKKLLYNNVSHILIYAGTIGTILKET